MTFLLTVNKTNNGLFIYRTKEIFTVNLCFINLAIYKGDLLHDINKIVKRRLSQK